MAVSLVSTLLLVFAAIYAADAFPSGAPQGACVTLSPDPNQHGSQPQTSPVPYSIDLSPFDDGAGGYQYTPGNTYTCKNSQKVTLLMAKSDVRCEMCA